MKPARQTYSLNRKINAYSGWLIYHNGLIYSVEAETSRKALNKFKKELKLKNKQPISK